MARVWTVEELEAYLLCPRSYRLHYIDHAKVYVRGRDLLRDMVREHLADVFLGGAEPQELREAIQKRLDERMAELPYKLRSMPVSTGRELLSESIRILSWLKTVEAPALDIREVNIPVEGEITSINEKRTIRVSGTADIKEPGALGYLVFFDHVAKHCQPNRRVAQVLTCAAAKIHNGWILLYDRRVKSKPRRAEIGRKELYAAERYRCWCVDLAMDAVAGIEAGCFPRTAPQNPWCSKAGCIMYRNCYGDAVWRDKP